MTGEIHIAIIGGGASGSITAIQLMRQLRVKAKVFLVEKDAAALFRGHAYSSELAYEPLNVPAGRMSIYNNLPDDFFVWLKHNRQHETFTEIARDSFVSRRWFGDYLSERLLEEQEQSEFTTLEVICASVTDITADGDDYKLLLDAGKELIARYLVFATGNELPHEIFNKETLAALGGRYNGNPWRGSYADLKPTESVLVIGTGLTAVDQVVSLHRNKHEGSIYCFSNNGLFPMVHAVHKNYSPALYEGGGNIHEALAYIRKQVSHAQQKEVEWQQVMDGIRPNIPALWGKLTIASKKLFLKRLRHFWEIHRHRMPAASAEQLEQLKTSGQLKVLSGIFSEIEVSATKIHFRYRDRIAGKEQTIVTDRLVNCTGPSGDYHKTGNTLVKNLLTKGWMLQDELKLGVVTGNRGEIISGDKAALKNAYAVGPLRKATEWESTALREIRMQAEAVAAVISGLPVAC